MKKVRFTQKFKDTVLEELSDIENNIPTSNNLWTRIASWNPTRRDLLAQTKEDIENGFIENTTFHLCDNGNWFSDQHRHYSFHGSFNPQYFFDNGYVMYIDVEGDYSADDDGNVYFKGDTLGVCHPPEDMDIEKLDLLEKELWQIIRYHTIKIEIDIKFTSNQEPQYFCVMTVKGVEYAYRGRNLWKRFRDMIKQLNLIYK